MAATHPQRTLQACCGTHIVHDGLSDVSYVLLPLLAQAFGLNLTQVGTIRTANRVAMAAFQLPAGLIAERFGERNLLALGTVLAGLAFIALGFANGYWMILLALFFAGIGSAVQHPLSSTIISHAYPGEGRRTALGTYNFAGDVGKFIFGGIVSLCVVAGISWQAPVVGFGVAALLTALRVLDLDHVGAEPRQRFRDRCSRLELREIDDADAVQGRLSSGSTGLCFRGHQGFHGNPLGTRPEGTGCTSTDR